jgi:hypothetical protein
LSSLDFLRATVVNKVAGLSDEQAFDHPVEPSELTLAGRRRVPSDRGHDSLLDIGYSGSAPCFGRSIV